MEMMSNMEMVSNEARLYEKMGPASGLAYLQRAKKRIEQPVYWTKGAESRDTRDVPCKGVAAVKFSILGALEREYDGTLEFESAMRALRQVTGRNPRKWNDRFWRSHKSVLRAMDRAMELELARR